MKNLNLILNGVLLIAVAVLFYLNRASGAPKAASAAGITGDVKIAYITSDSVLKHYDYLKDEQKKFDDKGKDIENDLKKRAQGLQSEIESYQRNVNSMTIGQAKAVEEDLGKKQQNFEMYRERVTQEVLADQDKLNKALYDKVTAFLKDYCSEKGYHIVLKFNSSSDLLYANQALDISKDVIAGLNEAYRKESGKLKTGEKK
jgi:outer membrane protein